MYRTQARQGESERVNRCGSSSHTIRRIGDRMHVGGDRVGWMPSIGAPIGFIGAPSVLIECIGAPIGFIGAPIGFIGCIG